MKFNGGLHTEEEGEEEHMRVEKYNVFKKQWHHFTERSALLGVFHSIIKGPALDNDPIVRHHRVLAYVCPREWTIP